MPNMSLKNNWMWIDNRNIVENNMIILNTQRYIDVPWNAPELSSIALSPLAPEDVSMYL